MSEKQPAALRLAAQLDGSLGDRWPSYVPQEAAIELRHQHARIEELESQLAVEAGLTAHEKLRADQITKQNRMQCAMRQELEARIAELEANLKRAMSAIPLLDKQQ